MKYKHKPTIVDAVQYPNNDSYPSWFVEAIINTDILVIDGEDLEIETLEGTMKAHKGDYIIKGTHEELWVCNHDIFEATYEVIDDGNDRN